MLDCNFGFYSGTDREYSDLEWTVAWLCSESDGCLGVGGGGIPVDSGDDDDGGVDNGSAGEVTLSFFINPTFFHNTVYLIVLDDRVVIYFHVKENPTRINSRDF